MPAISTGTLGLVAAACCCFALFVGATISYIRSVNALIRYLRAELPDSWQALTGGPRYQYAGAIEGLSVRQLIVGITRLRSEDAESRKLLRVARQRMAACAFLLAGAVIAVGWAFQGSNASHF